MPINLPTAATQQANRRVSTVNRLRRTWKYFGFECVLIGYITFTLTDIESYELTSAYCLND